MPDITMCMDHTCPQALNRTCYRFVAKPSQRQSYFAGSTRLAGEDRCDAYVAVWWKDEGGQQEGPGEGGAKGA